MSQRRSSPRHIVYKSNNFFINLLGKRFFRKVDLLLRSFQAQKLFGVDIGCGESHLLKILRENGAIGSVVAYDLSPENLHVAKLNYPEFKYVRGDAQAICFQKNVFDFVIAMEILEHVEKPQEVLREICRIAKSESYIILSVPNEPFFQLGNMLRGQYLKRYGKTPNHLSFWNIKQFRRLLKKFFLIEQQFVFSVFPWQVYVCRIRKDCV